MAVNVIVFDFDGTLIDSNQLKYDAFFRLFPSDESTRRIVTKVLNESLEQSRYVILRQVLARNSEIKEESIIETEVQRLVGEYNSIVLEGAKQCCEMPGAESLLRYLLSTGYRLYLNSTTPQEALDEIVRHRKWNGYFCGIFGFPNSKAAILRGIIRRESVEPEQVLVVGDRQSDLDSAEQAHCRFFRVADKNSLEKLPDYLKEN